MKNKGVTLIELLIVIVVLGIIVTFAIPSVQGIIRRSKLAAISNDTRTIEDAAEYYTVDVGERPYGALSGSGTCTTWNADSTNTFVVGTRSGSPIEDWAGPYMTTWPEETPLGGCYVYRSYKVGSAQNWARSNWFRYSDDVSINSIAPTDKDIEIVMIRFYPLTDNNQIAESREIAGFLADYIGEEQIFYVSGQAVIGYYIFPR